MFGIFSSLYCFSNVSAGLITTFGLGFFNSTTYFLIISASKPSPPSSASSSSETSLSPT